VQSILESMKFSANIPDDLLVFLDEQVTNGHYKSRSQALTEALQSWRTQKYAGDYAKAFAEYDDSWDVASADGLTEDDIR
jgi:Arc/MetJ-type ribon-helix-helix transcriptional regulator